MDAGEQEQCITTRVVPRSRFIPSQKKKEGAEAPSFRVTADFWLVGNVLASAIARCAERVGTTRTGTRIRNDQRQIAHRQITRANVADERKAVSILEVANRDHITIEAGHSGRCQGSVYRTRCDRTGVDLRRVVRALIPVQVARA